MSVAASGMAGAKPEELLENIHLNAEWRETARANLPQFEKAIPEDDSLKALDWLRRHSSLVAAFAATGKIISKDFYKFRVTHYIGEENEKGNRRSRPGFELLCASKLSEAAGTIDMRVTATYRFRNLQGKSQQMEFSIDKQGMKPDVPCMVLPTTLPEGDGPVMVLALTPRLEIVR